MKIKSENNMRYEEFNNIDIKNKTGVSSVGEDTLLMARYAKRVGGEKVLDIGTGTGFIAIYLFSLGINSMGSDISSNSIKCAKLNSKNNHLDVKFILSDLFEKIEDKFSLIVFNVPYGNTKAGFFTKYLEIFKSLIPRENWFVEKLTFYLIKNQRAKLIKNFLQEARGHLRENGKLLLYLHHKELDLVKPFTYKVLDNHKDLRLVMVSV